MEANTAYLHSAATIESATIESAMFAVSFPENPSGTTAIATTQAAWLGR